MFRYSSKACSGRTRICYRFLYARNPIVVRPLLDHTRLSHSRSRLTFQFVVRVASAAEAQGTGLNKGV